MIECAYPLALIVSSAKRIISPVTFSVNPLWFTLSTRKAPLKLFN
jgi:hypothetical protein